MAKKRHEVSFAETEWPIKTSHELCGSYGSGSWKSLECQTVVVATGQAFVSFVVLSKENGEKVGRSFMPDELQLAVEYYNSLP